MSNLTITAQDISDAKHAKDKVTSKREQLEQMVDKILELPRGEKRWKAAVELGIVLDLNDKDPSVNPYGLSAGAEYYGVQEVVKERRMNMKNKYGESEDKNSDWRAQFEWPAFVPQMIRMIDPQAFEKKNIPKLRRAFSEFVVSEVY